MGSLITRLALRRSLGLLIEDQEIVVSQISWTPVGPVETARHREAYQPDELKDAIDRFVGPLLGSRRRTPIAVGLPARRLFCTTRPNTGTRQDTAPEILLQEVLRSPSVIVDDMAIDLLRSRTRKGEVVSIASCRKRLLTNIMSSLGERPIRLERIEPAPSALVRAATFWKPAPGRARTIVRLFLGQGRCMAVLIASDVPLVWRSFELPAGDVSPALVSAVRSLRVMGSICGLDEDADALILHGRPDLVNKIDFDHLNQQLHTTIIHCDRPELGDGAEAFGLALGCQSQIQAFDLARQIKPPASIREIFPLGELAAQAALVICAGIFLFQHAGDLSRRLARAHADADRHAWAIKLSDSELEKMRKGLTSQIVTANDFLSSRINWTAYTRDLGTRLTKAIRLQSMKGVCPFAAVTKSSAAQARNLTLQFQAPAPRGTSAIPKVIDDFVDELRDHPLLKRDLPHIELGRLSWQQPNNKTDPLAASFTVVCTPQAKITENRSD